MVKEEDRNLHLDEPGALVFVRKSALQCIMDTCLLFRWANPIKHCFPRPLVEVEDIGRA